MPIQPLHLSESTSGEPIEITATSTPGDLVHTATNATDALDEIYLYVHHSGVGSAFVSVEFGSTDGPVELSVDPTMGLFQILPGLRLGGGATVSVFADATVYITGWVNRMTP